MPKKNEKEFKVSDHWIDLFRKISSRKHALVEALGELEEQRKELWEDMRKAYKIPKGKLGLNLEKKICTVLLEDD